ncbi:adenosylmethionine decarboxylase [Halobacteriovorax sp. XZX-3]|uniref:adenosylmethionine decarboxylase n=1 Tax=unclassified Halobacteriovorax TaxID=2639665 RepID=UPI003717079E
MIFEGSEKKAEIIVKDGLNLLEIPDTFWAQLVEKAKATILSSVKNDKLKAFLLSESSLFVWEDRMLIITCGQTTLIQAIDFFTSEYGKDSIKQLIFQRKNEYFSHMQHSTFMDDIKLLENKFNGTALRFGNIDDHHNYIYFLDQEYTPSADDHTYELLMYEISCEARKLLTDENVTKDQIRDLLKLDKILPGFELDDFVFNPYGYSLNAIKDDNYFTCHITPQEECPYISFETDIDMKEIASVLIDAMEPISYDFIEFCPNQDGTCGLNVNPGEYKAKTQVESFLKCGYIMYFSHFYKLRTNRLKPYKLL